MGRNSTLTGRTAVWHAALSVGVNPIGGTGFQSFWLGPRYNYMAEATGMYLNQAHNGYLETYLNLGWIGVSFLALILITAYLRAVKGVGRMWPEASLGLAYFMVAITENFTEASFGMAGPIWIGFLATSMALSGELLLPGLEPAADLAVGRPGERPIPVQGRLVRTNFRDSLVPTPSRGKSGDFRRNSGRKR